MSAGWQVRVLTVLGRDDRLRLWRDHEEGLRAEIHRAGRPAEPVPADRIRVRSLSAGGSGAALSVRRGDNRWRFQRCDASRYDAARFDDDRFAGGICPDPAIFNVSRFGPVADEPVAAVFADPGGTEPTTEITIDWEEHLPGAFTVHLPADLPPRFGGRFNSARFALPDAGAEPYPDSVTEPPDDDDYLVDRINGTSRLVRAAVVPVVPLGWQAVAMPFRKPRHLTLGSDTQAARLYLSEEGIGGFIELESKIPGDAGNSIRVTARKSGPARFDVTVAFIGGRFETARQIVEGAPLPSLTAKLLAPGPVGVLQGKAAGIRAEVTRERTADRE
jgi:hypothetical protein